MWITCYYGFENGSGKHMRELSRFTEEKGLPSAEIQHLKMILHHFRPHPQILQLLHYHFNKVLKKHQECGDSLSTSLRNH